MDLTRNTGVIYKYPKLEIFDRRTNRIIEVPPDENGEFVYNLVVAPSDTSEEVTKQAVELFSNGEFTGLREIIEIDPIPTFNITFILNGGTIDGNPDHVTIRNILHGTSVTPPTPRLVGYQLVGWDPPGRFTNVIRHATVIAQWEELWHRVHFDIGAGSRIGGGQLVQSVRDGQSAQPPIISRLGHMHTGWNISHHEITGDTIIRATWQAISYTVTFDLGGGRHVSGGTLRQTVVHGGAVVVPQVHRSLHQFIRWVPSVSGVSLTNVTQNVVFRAEWRSMTIDGDGTFPGGQCPPDCPHYGRCPYVGWPDHECPHRVNRNAWFYGEPGIMFGSGRFWGNRRLINPERDCPKRCPADCPNLTCPTVCPNHPHCPDRDCPMSRCCPNRTCPTDPITGNCPNRKCPPGCTNQNCPNHRPVWFYGEPDVPFGSGRVFGGGKRGRLCTCEPTPFRWVRVDLGNAPEWILVRFEPHESTPHGKLALTSYDYLLGTPLRFGEPGLMYGLGAQWGDIN